MNADCSAGSPITTMTRPNTSEIGKPTAKRFSAGAARLMTPKAMFTMSSAVTPGRATASAPEKICVPQLTMLQ